MARDARKECGNALKTLSGLWINPPPKWAIRGHFTVVQLDEISDTSLTIFG